MVTDSGWILYCLDLLLRYEAHFGEVYVPDTKNSLRQLRRDELNAGLAIIQLRMHR